MDRNLSFLRESYWVEKESVKKRERREEKEKEERRKESRDSSDMREER